MWTETWGGGSVAVQNKEIKRGRERKMWVQYLKMREVRKNNCKRNGWGEAEGKCKHFPGTVTGDKGRWRAMIKDNRGTGRAIGQSRRF